MKDGVEATTYWVTLVDSVGQREVPCYDPRGKDLKEDAPLPEGWEVKTSKAGKPYLAAPRVSGGGGGSGRSVSGPSTAWRNTEAGAKYEQERMDRRTALMQAVATDHYATEHDMRTLGVKGYADEFYAWLRRSVGGEALAGVRGSNQLSSAVSPPTTMDEGGGQPTSPSPQVTPPPRPPKRSPNQPPSGWDQ
jgi:hypothetical protein